MSQEQILQIIKQSKGTKFSADEILCILRQERELNEQSFYSNMEKLEKDENIKHEDVIVQRTSTGRIQKFTKRVWYYAGS